MARKLFGTDGIRGRTNIEPMTAETALKVAMAAALQFRRGDHRHRVVIEKTRDCRAICLSRRWQPASSPWGLTLS